MSCRFARNSSPIRSGSIRLFVYRSFSSVRRNFCPVFSVFHFRLRRFFPLPFFPPLFLRSIRPFGRRDGWSSPRSVDRSVGRRRPRRSLAFAPCRYRDRAFAGKVGGLWSRRLGRSHFKQPVIGRINGLVRSIVGS